DLQRRRPHDSVARGVGRHAGRRRSDQRARDAPGDGDPRRHEAVRIPGQRDGRAGSELHQRPRHDVSPKRQRDQTRGAEDPRVATVSGPERGVHTLLVAGRIRRPRNQRDGVDRLFGRQHADAAAQHGAGAVRAAERGRMGARAELVLDRRDAGAHELRVDAGAESEVPHRHGGGLVPKHVAGARRFPDVAPDSRLRLDDVQRSRHVRRFWWDVDGVGHATADQGIRPRASDPRISGVPVRMMTRREFVKNGVTAFTISLAAPRFVSDLARAQGASSRNLIVLDLSGGNDGLSLLVPYTDSFYYSRRPTLAIAAANVLQIGSDSSGKALGLHPKLAGLKDIFNQGRLALIQRVGYENSSRSHFSGTDIWSTANPSNSSESGWVGRYLSTLGPSLDPLAAWNTTGDTPHAMQMPGVSVASIPSVSTYAFSSPNSGGEALLERSTAATIASHVPIDRPHVAFVSTTVQAAMATLDRVGSVGQYKPTVTYPNNGFGQALQAIAGAMAKGIGTKVFWVQTGGFDTHASQDTNGDTGAYVKLMTTLNDGLSAFYNDVKNNGLLNDTLLLSFSEFGRRIGE